MNTIASFETFRKFGMFERDNLQQSEPSCINGNVCIRKYKITVELIEEPKEILAERLQKMWDECDNWHHWDALKSSAKEIGYELKGDAGNSHKKRRKGGSDGRG